MFCNNIRGIVGTFVALCFTALVASCGGGDSSGNDVPPVELTRHQRFSKNSVADSPMLRSNVVLKNGQQSSQAHQNGRVVDVFPVWTRDALGEYHEAVYVLYSFLDSSVINSGSVSPTSAVNTELWRYSSEGGWCPIISGSLGFSTSTAQLLRPAGQVGFDRATPIRLMVGTSDGAVGQIAFVDPNPSSGNCTSVTQAPGMSSLYTVMHETGMRGGITNLKLVDVTPAFAPTVPVNPLAHVKGVYVWGGSVCSANGIDASGNCTAWTSQAPMVGLLDAGTGQWLNGPGANMSLLVRDSVPGPRTDANSASSEAQSLDVQLLASPDYSSVTTNVVISYVQGPQQLWVSTSKSPVYTSAGVWFDPWVGNGRSFDVPIQSSGGSVNWLPRQSGQGTAFLFTPNRYGTYAGGQVCLVGDFGQVPSCSWATPPFEDYFSTNGSPAFGAAVPFEAAAVDWSAFKLDPRQFTDHSLMSANPLVFQNQPTMYWMDSALNYPGVTGYAVTRVSPNFYTTINGQSQLVLSEARALVAPSQDGKSLRAFLVAATTDVAAPTQQSTTVITEGQLLKGGISLCVVTAQPNQWPVDFSACSQPRAAGVGEAGDGYVYGDATIVSGNNTFMAAPSLIRFSTAPDASVVKVYSVTKAGRISVAFANTAAAQWNSVTNGWTTISFGRSATCATALNKPALPDPPPQAPPATPPTPPKHWWQKAVAHAFTKSFIAGTLAMAADVVGEAALGPVGALAAGFVVDVAVGAALDVADDKGKQEKAAAAPADADKVYAQWLAVFDQVSLSENCTVDP